MEVLEVLVEVLEVLEEVFEVLREVLEFLVVLKEVLEDLLLNLEILQVTPTHFAAVFRLDGTGTSSLSVTLHWSLRR